MNNTFLKRPVHYFCEEKHLGTICCYMKSFDEYQLLFSDESTKYLKLSNFNREDVVIEAQNVFETKPLFFLFFFIPNLFFKVLFFFFLLCFLYVIFYFCIGLSQLSVFILLRACYHETSYKTFRTKKAPDFMHFVEFVHLISFI